MLERSFSQLPKTEMTRHPRSGIQLLYISTRISIRFFILVDFFCLRQHCRCTFLCCLIMASVRSLSVFITAILRSLLHSTSGCSPKYFQFLVLFPVHGSYAPFSLHVLGYSAGRWMVLIIHCSHSGTFPYLQLTGLVTIICLFIRLVTGWTVLVEPICPTQCEASDDAPVGRVGGRVCCPG